MQQHKRTVCISFKLHILINLEQGDTHLCSFAGGICVHPCKGWEGFSCSTVHGHHGLIIFGRHAFDFKLLLYGSIFVLYGSQTKICLRCCWEKKCCFSFYNEAWGLKMNEQITVSVAFTLVPLWSLKNDTLSRVVFYFYSFENEAKINSCMNYWSKSRWDKNARQTLLGNRQVGNKNLISLMVIIPFSLWEQSVSSLP